VTKLQSPFTSIKEGFSLTWLCSSTCLLMYFTIRAIRHILKTEKTEKKTAAARTTPFRKCIYINTFTFFKKLGHFTLLICKGRLPAKRRKVHNERSTLLPFERTIGQTTESMPLIPKL